MKLIVAGSNSQGQLSTAHTEDCHHFTPSHLPKDISEIICIASGANHSVLLADTGLYASGDARHGQLGSDLESKTSFSPIQLPFADRYPRLVACSWESTYVVLSSHTHPSDIILSMGADDFGALGVTSVSSFNAVSMPVQDNYTVKSIVAGPRHVIAILNVDKGTVTVGWGASRHGQLGSDKATKPSSLPTIISTDPIISASVGSQHTVLLHHDGSIHTFGSNKKHQLERLESVRDVDSIRCTWNGSYVLTHANDVYATGSNTHSQLGGEECPNRIPTNGARSLVCGSEHVLLFTDSDVWGWGWNEHGNLGMGHTDDITRPLSLLSNERVLGVWAGCGTTWIAIE